MGIPPIDDVREILSDFELRMRSVIESAWKEWLEVPNRARFSARSRASMVFDFIKTGALVEFNGDPNIRAIVKGQTVHFLFRDRTLVRFKKANSAGIGSNIETQAVIQFVDPKLTIPGLLPEIYRVEVCYHLNKLATEIETLAVTARDRGRKIWSYPLQRPASGEIVPLPPRGGDTPPAPAQVRIRKPVERPETTGE
jgi:hypothetical protein